MKLSSLSGLNSSLPNHSIKTELVAGNDGKSLVLVNGRPLQIDTNAEALPKSVVSANQAQTESLVSQPGQILARAGLENTQENQELLQTMRQYGVPLTPENAGKAAAVAAAMPSFSLDSSALGAVVLVLLRRLPFDSAELVHKYLGGKLKFATLFQENPQLAEVFRENRGLADVLQRLQQMMTQREKQSFLPALKDGEDIKGLTENLLLQELMSETGNLQKENQVYFQWPIFWANRDLPDTLEGEAFFKNGKEQGFCLRLLVSPPSLGQIEVAMNHLDQALWVHFGADQGVLEDIRSIFPLLLSQLENAGFAQVRLTAGKLRKIEHFLLEAVTPTDSSPSLAKLDIRV